MVGVGPTVHLYTVRRIKPPQCDKTAHQMCLEWMWSSDADSRERERKRERLFTSEVEKILNKQLDLKRSVHA